jgi:hypothetical protein
VCEAFGYGMYVQGVFNGDPHPGNLLVQHVKGEGGKRRVRPVLLDWGLAKTLTDKLRVGNSRIVYSAYHLDVAGMVSGSLRGCQCVSTSLGRNGAKTALTQLDGMLECGLDVDKIDIFQDLANVSFLMKNTAPGEEARAASKRFVEDLMEKQKAKVGWGGHGTLRTHTAHTHARLSSPSIAHTTSSPLPCGQPKSERNPLRAISGEATQLLFLARVAELLQGLGARMGARVEYMDIMAAYCKKAILEASQPRAGPPTAGSKWQHLPPPASFVDRKVRLRLLVFCPLSSPPS